MEWKKYMARLCEQTLKEGTTIDQYSPGIQLKRGFSILRLEKSKLPTKETEPKIVGEINKHPVLWG